MAVSLEHLTPDLVSRRYPAVDKIVTQELVDEYFSCMKYPLPVRAKVPVAFYACFREAEFKVFDDLRIDLKQLLHVSQSYTYFTSLQVGDVVRSQVSIQKVSSRKMGAGLVVFLELKNEYFRNQEKVAEADGTVIVRELL